MTDTECNWYLERIGTIKSIKNLKYGNMSFGRTPNCDVVIDSVYCSRSQCTISINKKGEILLSDTSSNGTYVNENAIIKTNVILKEYDHIGMGCKWTEDNEAYFVYILKNYSSKIIPKVEVIDDDNDVIVIEDDVDVITINDDEEDLNLDFSQHCLLQIKDEIRDFEESIENHCIDDGKLILNKPTKLENSSPDYDIENDEDYHPESDTLHLKISQSNYVEKLKPKEEIREDKNEITLKPCSILLERVNDKKRLLKRSKGFNNIVHPKRKFHFLLDSESESDIDMNDNKNDKNINKSQITIPPPSKIKKSVTTAPEVIDAPFMPKRKAILRGISIETASKKMMLQQLKGKKNISNIRHSKNEKRKNIENRKIRLKEIAKEQKLKYEQEPKKLVSSSVSSLPKVKNTTENRGAFLISGSIGKIKNVPNRRKTIDGSSTSGTLNVGSSVSLPSVINMPKIPKVSKIVRSNSYASIGSKGDNKVNQPILVKEKLNENMVISEKSHKNNIDNRMPCHVTSDRLPTLIDFPPAISSTSFQNKTVMFVTSTKILKSSLVKKSNSDNIDNKKSVKKVRFDMRINYYKLPLSAIPPPLSPPSPLSSPPSSPSLPRTLPPTLPPTLPSTLPHVKSLQFQVPPVSHSPPPSPMLSQLREDIISNVLKWDPKWLRENYNHEMNYFINGPGHILHPMVNCFSSFETYLSILIPLMKLELWFAINADFMKLKKKQTAMIDFINKSTIQIGSNQKNIYYGVVPYQGNKYFNIGDLLIIENEKPLFAYVRKIQVENDPCRKYLGITLETGRDDAELSGKKLNVSFLSFISVHISTFEYVYSLRKSPLCGNILNPALNAVSNLAINKHKYMGFDKLNKTQIDILFYAYSKCIEKNKPSITIIEGPPGTGKSLLIRNLVFQLLNSSRKLRILICAPSNAALDNIALKLLEIRKQFKDKLKLVRFGIYTRMNPTIAQISIQKLSERFIKETTYNYAMKNKLDPALLTQNLQQKIFLQNKINELSQKSDPGKNLTVLTEELEKCRQKLNQINHIIDGYKVKSEPQAAKTILDGAHVIFATLTGCMNLMKYDQNFDICIVDEASQSIEPWTLIPLQMGVGKLILIGDTNQLPPTIISQEAKKNGYCESLFTRISKNFRNITDSPVKSLLVQYRMHPDICQWPNQYFYKGFLESDPSSIDREFPLRPYILINLNFIQDSSDTHNLISNNSETNFIVNLLIFLLSVAKPKKYSYGIITPYTVHREDLIKNVKPIINTITIDTIDSYQGQEKDIIIISMARTFGIGFLSNSQRLNVALTRARKCIILCGNFSSFKFNSTWNSLLEDARERKVIYCSDKLDFNMLKK